MTLTCLNPFAVRNFSGLRIVFNLKVLRNQKALMQYGVGLACVLLTVGLYCWKGIKPDSSPHPTRKDALAASPELGDKVLRQYLSSADVVIEARVVSESYGSMSDGVTYVTSVEVLDVIQGNVQEKQTLSICYDREGSEDILRMGDHLVLFLRERNGLPELEIANRWFGSLPYSRAMVDALHREVAIIMEEARWAPLKNVKYPYKTEDIPILIKIADGPDKEVAFKALSKLSYFDEKHGFERNEELVAFLNRKMRDPDPHLSLHAADISCYSGDWSGFDVILERLDHSDPKVRYLAAESLGDPRFSKHSEKIRPLLEKRLRTEKEPNVLRRVDETIRIY